MRYSLWFKALLIPVVENFFHSGSLLRKKIRNRVHFACHKLLILTFEVQDKLFYKAAPCSA